MFSTKEQLKKRTGKHGTSRFDYLQELLTEFQTTKSEGSKEEILANLANFAYDPINYEYFRALSILDLFLDQLSVGGVALQEFAIAGLCNVCQDQQSRDYILSQNGARLAIEALSSPQEGIVLSAITILINLVTKESKSGKDIVTPAVVDCMLRYRESSNRRLSNLATIFLEDCCTEGDIEEAKKVVSAQ